MTTTCQARWARCVVIVAGSEGNFMVRGYSTPACAGLAVAGLGTNKFSVTHVASGKGIRARYKMLREAKAALLALAPLADWTKDGKAICALGPEGLTLAVTQALEAKRATRG